MKKALLVGATGLVGSSLLQKLLASPAYTSVVVVARTAVPEHPKLTQVVMPDLAEMEQHKDMLSGVEDVYCCLGTTIKKAGSRQAFRKVDYDYPLLMARLAKENGVQRFLIISSMGADASSKMFYSRVKGELEEALRALALPSTAVFRPSLLLGERKEFRLGEKTAEWLFRPISFLFRGRLLPYRPIQASDVAAVMHRVGQMYIPGYAIYENEQLHRMAPHS